MKSRNARLLNRFTHTKMKMDVQERLCGRKLGLIILVGRTIKLMKIEIEIGG